MGVPGAHGAAHRRDRGRTAYGSPPGSSPTRPRARPTRPSEPERRSLRGQVRTPPGRRANGAGRPGVHREQPEAPRRRSVTARPDGPRLALGGHRPLAVRAAPRRRARPARPRPQRQARRGAPSPARRTSTDAEAAIEQLGLAPVALIGHSMGALTAWQLAAKRPDLVQALIICDMRASALGAASQREWEDWFQSWPVPFATLGGRTQVVRRGRPVGGAPQPVPRRVLRRGDGRARGRLAPVFSRSQMLASRETWVHDAHWEELAQVRARPWSSAASTASWAAPRPRRWCGSCRAASTRRCRTPVIWCTTNSPPTGGAWWSRSSRRCFPRTPDHRPAAPGGPGEAGGPQGGERPTTRSTSAPPPFRIEPHFRAVRSTGGPGKAVREAPPARRKRTGTCAGAREYPAGRGGYFPLPWPVLRNACNA